MPAVAFVNEAVGSAVGELYVQKYFPQENQQQMAVLVANLRTALQDRLEHLSWMSASTKAEALHKLANLEVQIGRPKVWIDYTKLAVSPDDLYGDAQREKAFDWQRRVSQIHGLWNKSDWRFWPQYSTAYTENNQLIFTAAMLQAPFFNATADPAINYGGIGAVIGHELTHSFDDQGRETDADNRLRNSWTMKDAAQFKERADLLSTQYSAMEPLPGLHLKGDVTLGENIADLGGLTIALEAYRGSLHGQASPVLDGFTGDQRFFLGWRKSGVKNAATTTYAIWSRPTFTALEQQGSMGSYAIWIAGMTLSPSSQAKSFSLSLKNVCEFGKPPLLQGVKSS